MIDFIKENLFSIITAIIALIAIWQTQVQIRLSNKQYLFKARIEKYTLIYNLLKLYKENQSILDYSKNKDNEAIIVDMQFEGLTNSVYLKDITQIIYDPKNHEEKVKFLTKLDELEQSANEIKFLFKGKFAELLKDFINDYKNVLMELYKYQIVQNMMIDKDNIANVNKIYKELQESYGEHSHRERLYNSIKDLDDSYKKLEKNKVIQTLEKRIKL